VADSQLAETIALNRYRNGLISYLDVICAQTALVAKPGQQDVLQIVLRR
jgi:outer membrane protein TolC